MRDAMGSSLIDQVLARMLAEEGTSDEVAVIRDKVAEIDRSIGRLLNAILHDPLFQSLEATWRGLQGLIRGMDAGRSLRVKVLDLDKEELARDLQAQGPRVLEDLVRRPDPDRRASLCLLIGDYAFDLRSEDIDLLRSVGALAAAAGLPFIAAAGPRLLGLRGFRALETAPPSLPIVFDAPTHIKWRSFRAAEESRQVGLIVLRALVRLPYGPERPSGALPFVEEIRGPDDYLWGSPAYLFGRAVAEPGWIEDLPLDAADDSGVVGPVDARLTERQAAKLLALGLIPLLCDRDRVLFPAAPPCHQAGAR